MTFDENSLKLDLVDKMKGLSGAELIRFHKIVSAISDPLELTIAGPRAIDPKSSTMIKTRITGPIPPRVADDQEIVVTGILPVRTASATLSCPQCGHAVKIKLECE